MLLEVNQHTKKIRRLENNLKNTRVNSKAWLELNATLTVLFAEIAIKGDNAKHLRISTFDAA